MKFQFRLEKLLRFARMRETMKRMEIASCLSRIRFIKNRLETIESELRELVSKSTGEWAMGWAYFQSQKVKLHADERVKLLALNVKEEAELTKRKRELERLLYRKKALESLREKQLKEFKALKNRKEQSEMEELFRLRQESR